MADHVPLLIHPDEPHGRVMVPAEVCEACSDFGAGILVPASFCELAAAVMQRTAYGKCPVCGCGVGGDVEQSGDLAGFVRLWRHLNESVSLTCIGSATWVWPLPLAAPPDGERQRLANEIAAAAPPRLFDDDGYPLTLF